LTGRTAILTTYFCATFICINPGSYYKDDLICLLVFNTTFSNISAISWGPVLAVEEAGVPEENHRPWPSNW
jgi:hypothetical protein